MCIDSLLLYPELESKHDFVVKVRDVVKTWKRPVFVVMRFLFAFLNHLSEFSDENLMDPYNLAICFGPTLVPIPEERDQVQYQCLVNELIKNFIIFHEDIFPASAVPGPRYEKYLTIEPELDDDMGEEVGDSPTEPAVGEDQDMMDGESEVTEDGKRQTLSFASTVNKRPLSFCGSLDALETGFFQAKFM